MAIQFQLTQMAFQSGLQEGLDPRLAPLGTLTTAENVRWSKTGRLEKRYGTTPLPTSTRIPTTVGYTTGTISAGCRLGVRGSELFLIDGRYLHSWSPALYKWIRRDTLPDVGVEWSDIDIGGAALYSQSSWAVGGSDNVSPPSYAVIGNKMCAVWVEYEGQQKSADPPTYLVYAVIDVVTGAIIKPKTFLKRLGINVFGSPQAGQFSPKVIEFNGYFHVFFVDNLAASPSDNRLFLRSIDVGTLEPIGTDQLISPSTGSFASITGFDACIVVPPGPAPAFRMAFVITCPVGIQYATGFWDSTLGLPNVGRTTYLVTGGAKKVAMLQLTNLNSVHILYENSSSLVYWMSIDAYGSSLTPSTFIAGGASFSLYDFFIFQYDTSPLSSSLAFAITVLDTNSASGCFTTTIISSSYTVGNPNLTSSSTVRELDHVCIASKPFSIDGKTYMLVAEQVKYASGPEASSTHLSTHVVDITLADWGEITQSSVTSRTLRYTPTHVHNVKPSVPLAFFAGNQGRASTPLMVEGAVRLIESNVSGALGVVSLFSGQKAADAWRSVLYGRESYLSIGALSAYDGQIVFDYGFSRPAAFFSVNSTLAIPGDRTVQTTASFQSAAGVLHRSSSSLALLSQATTSTNARWLSYGISAKKRSVAGAANRGINHILYVSGANSSSVQWGASEPQFDQSLQSLWTQDTATPVPKRGTIYTAGGILDDEQPPSLTTICLHKDRIWGVDGSGTQVWFSKSFLDDYGVAPGFNSQFRIQFSNKITALASLDEKLIAFGEDTLYYLLGGDGITPDGLRSDLQGPFSIQSDVGCTNPRSVVSTPDGVMFQSIRGIYLLTRGLELAWIGRAVKDKLAAYPVITSAVLVAAHNEVRFTANNAAGDAGIVLVYNYIEKQWTTYQYAAFGYPSYAPIADAIVWNGVYTFVTPNGQVYQETTESHIDAGFYWVPMTIETSWVSATGPIGFQTVRSIQLVGTSHSDHSLTVSIGFDGNATYQQVKNWSEGSAVTSIGDLEQAEIAITNRRKCQMLRVKIQDGTPIATLPVGTGKGASFDALGIETGVKAGFKTNPATRKG